MTPRIHFEGVRFAYTPGDPVLRGLDLELAGGVTLVLGPNGAGKSTLLKLAAGIEKPDAGRVRIDGYDLWTREVEARRPLAFVPDEPDITPFATVDAVLAFVARTRGESAQAGFAARDHLGLGGFGGRSIRELSRGQRHRVLLAAARIGNPGILILDEPLSALDRGLRQTSLAWIEATAAAGGAALVVTHELEPFLGMTHRVVAVDRGEVRLIEAPAGIDERRRQWEALARGKD